MNDLPKALWNMSKKMFNTCTIYGSSYYMHINFSIVLVLFDLYLSANYADELVFWERHSFETDQFNNL